MYKNPIRAGVVRNFLWCFAGISGKLRLDCGSVMEKVKSFCITVRTGKTAILNSRKVRKTVAETQRTFIITAKPIINLKIEQ